jgi:hypothetical protein
MAKLVTKFRYYKPRGKTRMGGYAKYIATRDGVEKCDEKIITSPASIKQKELILQILEDFPDSAEMLEYEDYVRESTKENASEFITRAIENNAHIALSEKTYADYIATRPGVELSGSHGLFSNLNQTVSLTKVSNELNDHDGNVWTMIISLRREDAARLSYDNGEAWRHLLRQHSNDLANALKIPYGDLKWYAAFHNESHHPHIHLLAYTDNPSVGFLTKEGVKKLRSVFGQAIFKNDLEHIYVEQTARRNTLKKDWNTLLLELLQQIENGTLNNPILEQKLVDLSVKLSRAKGKKQYGYLSPDTRKLIDSIVDIIAEDANIAALYDLWWEKKYEILKTYSSQMPPKIPLSQNKEFKSIKNDIIREAMRIHQEQSEQKQELPQPKKANESKSQSSSQSSQHSQPSQTKGHSSAPSAVAVTRLLKNISNTFKEKIYNDPSAKLSAIDKRQRQEIEDKKNAVIQQY